MGRLTSLPLFPLVLLSPSSEHREIKTKRPLASSIIFLVGGIICWVEFSPGGRKKKKCWAYGKESEEAIISTCRSRQLVQHVHLHQYVNGAMRRRRSKFKKKEDRPVFRKVCHLQKNTTAFNAFCSFQCLKGQVTEKDTNLLLLFFALPRIERMQVQVNMKWEKVSGCYLIGTPADEKNAAAERLSEFILPHPPLILYVNWNYILDRLFPSALLGKKNLW